MNKKKKGFLCLALCLILTVSFGMQGLRVNATNMSSITSDSIRNKQDQIKQAEKEREQMKSNLSNLEQIKKDLETQKTNLKNYVTQLDQNLSQIEQNIADLKNKITAKEEEIAKTQAELDAALEREENQKDAMIRRIRIMYEKGDSYILDMMLKAESFSDFLNRADFMDLIMAYDRQQWKDFMENRKYIELCKEELEAEKAILDEAKAGVEQEQANMEALIDQKNRDITAYESDITNKEQAIKEYKQSIADQDAEIAALEAAIAAPGIGDIHKAHLRARLASALRNRPGTRAADFTYTTGNGSHGTLHGFRAGYTLLMFYNPGCPECGRIEEYIPSSEVFAPLIASGRLKVLAVYPGEDIEAWREHLAQMPAGWTVGHAPMGKDGTAAYDLPGIPAFYLLDRDKTVLVKYRPVDVIEQWLTQHADGK